MRFVSTTALTIIASAAAASLACAQDFDFPQRKSGQWEIKMITQPAGAAPDMSMTACVDAASDAEMMRAGLSMSKEMCPQQDIKREGDGYVIDSTCKMGPMETRSRSVITGDFQSAYTVETTTETAGGPAAMAGTNVFRQEARWVSAECGNGLQPGDMLMPGGMKMNINEMMKMMGGG
jgi:hypothetical protein